MAIKYLSGRRIQGTSTGYSTVSYEEDFTTDPAGWNDDSYTNRTNNRVQIRPSTSSSASGVAYIDLSNASNLGSNLSDTKWTVDFKIDVVTLTQSITNYVYVRYWLSDNTSSSNSGDEIGFNHWARNSESGRARFYKVNGGTSSILSTHVGVINSTGVRYCRIIRESPTSARMLISTNADWSGAVDSGSQTIDSTINALKYFKITCTGYNGSNRLNVNLDDLRVYDGIDKGTTEYETTTTSSDYNALTNVQVGSRFEETDTRKIYHRDDIDFKEVGTTPTNYRHDSWYQQLTGEAP